MNQNILLPYCLFTDIIRILLRIDICDYDDAFRSDYDYVLQGLQKKLSALDLRDSYSQIIFAPDEVSRSVARSHYFQKKLSAREDC